MWFKSEKYLSVTIFAAKVGIYRDFPPFWPCGRCDYPTYMCELGTQNTANICDRVDALIV